MLNTLELASSAPTVPFSDPQKLADQMEQSANEAFGGNKLAMLLGNIV
jgi:hypothetical protein